MCFLHSELQSDCLDNEDVLALLGVFLLILENCELGIRSPQAACLDALVVDINPPLDAMIDDLDVYLGRLLPRKDAATDDNLLRPILQVHSFNHSRCRMFVHKPAFVLSK